MATWSFGMTDVWGWIVQGINIKVIRHPNENISYIYATDQEL